MSEHLTLPAGTIAKVNGMPFRLSQDTAVEGRKESLQQTDDASGAMAVDAPQQREAIIRAAVAAMPNCNPGIADDLIEGHSIHMEADDLVAVWQAALDSPSQSSREEK